MMSGNQNNKTKDINMYVYKYNMLVRINFLSKYNIYEKE